MKKIILFLIIAVACTNCDKNPSESSQDSKFSSARTNYAKLYLDEPPYATGTDELTGTDADLQLILDDSLLNSNASWSFYDSKYSQALHYGLQDYIAWIVLSQKDMIGMAESDPSNVAYQAILKKYIDSMVKNEYIGYCLLYSALEQVDDNAYKKDKAKQILNYSKDVTFFDRDQSEQVPQNVSSMLQTTKSYLNHLTVMAGE